ncbi:leucine-rich repeat-containing protein 3B-like [Megalops cyprinoides]|uniref:leucine-rich repeat-containing protein 3B-like n=1 Tax=Megalops cyprinoides TaxID=118141 RepID=UPI0018643C4E|nr:leucine-rich repeat-containing protein 3B-like [Megalops cyprinoides]
MSLLDLWLSRSVPTCLLLQSLLLIGFCFPSADTCPKGCACVRGDGLNVTCSHAQLRAIPGDLPPDTVLLRLDHNQISAIPPGAFRGLVRLRELNLSHNAVETVGESALRGVESTLRTLDLSHNRISSVHRDAFARLKARVHIGDNPWHCDCALQQALRVMAYNHEAAGRVLCHSSPLRDHQEGRPFLAMDADLCNLAKRTTDYAMLVTMFGWFAMVISYVVYYVRQNQEDARRHLEYLKSLPSKAPAKPDEADDISTVV